MAQRYDVYERDWELDSGYVSRLLRSLEHQGLVKEPAATDGRVRRVRLTRKGLREVANLIVVQAHPQSPFWLRSARRNGVD